MYNCALKQLNLINCNPHLQSTIWKLNSISKCKEKFLKNPIQPFQCLDVHSKLAAQKLVSNPQESSDSTWI